ncbi:phosphate/phosphite/phosphonate ABC transporter substrate-binding protein [Gracilibacillus suaedae]|uniref:phosphate/phosphite/phosphonate ABC transporter substrate-binding protein n=1 Tax=Gracilibacillus suaedae TaxID=2820273 RepID=UPI001ABEC3F4|nr:phosphate/phosphite/phosphonate ABC transporter substrate-binding protein [Gracilibacillus suaedae]
MMKHLKLLLLLMLTVVVVSACGNSDEAAANENAANDGAWPEVLKVAKLQTEGDESLERTSTEFWEDLGEELEIEIEFFEGSDYTSMIEAMRAEQLDLTNFGPFGYIIATERSGAKPIAIMGQSEEEAFYTSQIVTHADSGIETLADLEDKSFLFVDPASTSGNLFPRSLLLNELGLTNDDLENYFSSVSYSGGHDKSVLAIANGDGDAAAVAPMVLDMLAESGLVDKADFKVIGETAAIPSAPLTYREGLPEDLIEQITEFSLNYHEVNPEYFELQGYSAYYPVEDSDYDVVRDVAENLDMSPEELLE